MSENDVWKSSNTPLYEKGDLVVYNGLVLECKGSFNGSAISPLSYNRTLNYAMGDLCEYEGVIYTRNDVDPWYRGPFRQEHWAKHEDE